VVVSQELECVDEEKGGNKDKTVLLEQTQDITDKTLLESVDKTIETHRTSTRNRKNPKYKRQ